MSVGEYAADTRAAVAELRRHPEVTHDRRARPLDGRRGRAGGGRRGRRRDGGDRGVDARRPVPADPPDVPPRPAAHPGADRLAARLVDDPGLPPAARPHGPLGERDQRRARHRPAGDADPRVRGRRRADRRSRAPRRGPPGGAPRRRHRDPRSSRAAGTRGCTSFPSTAPRSPGSSRRTSAARSRPTRRPAVAAAVPAERLPDPERLTTLDEEPGGFRSLSRVLRRQESAASTTNGATTPEPTTHGVRRDDMATSALPDPAATIPG